MRINLRVYKRWDPDIIALHEAGYPVGIMMKMALINYANGTPLFYYLDEIVPVNIDDRETYHMLISIPNTEKNVVYMMTHLKNRTKSSFVKMVFRNALISQNLGVFFTDPNLQQLSVINNSFRNVGTLKNVVPCSALRNHDTVISIFGKQIAKGRKKAINVNSNPYINMPNSPQIPPISIQAQQISQPMFNYSPAPIQVPQMPIMQQPVVQTPVANPIVVNAPASQELRQEIAPPIPESNMNTLSVTPGVYTGLPEETKKPLVINEVKNNFEEKQATGSDTNSTEMTKDDNARLLSMFDNL